MKILMFNNEFPPLGGGTGTVNNELFNCFRSFPDLYIDLVTSAQGNKRENLFFSPTISIYKLPVNNSNIHHSSNRELITYTWKAFFESLKMQREHKYDLCMVWSTVPAGIIALFFKYFFNLKYFVRVGGCDIPGFEKRYNKLYPFLIPIIKLIWRKAEIVVVKCKSEMLLVQNIIPDLPVQIIYNGINFTKFKPKSKFPSEEIRILCVARLIQRKGQETLIKAVDKLKQNGYRFQVEFVGEGDDYYRLLALTVELNLEFEINFKGYVSRDEIVSCYVNSDIFVLPSYNEGMSNAVLEAMACGLPVVVTKTGGTDELVNESSNGYVFDAGDYNQLYHILSKIIENKMDLIELGKKSRETAEKFAWNEIAQIYDNLFQKIVNQ